MMYGYVYHLRKTIIVLNLDLNHKWTLHFTEASWGIHQYDYRGGFLLKSTVDNLKQ